MTLIIALLLHIDEVIATGGDADTQALNQCLTK